MTQLQSKNKGNQLGEEEVLWLDEYLTSPNGQYQLSLQTDGNLVLHDTRTNKLIWDAGTHGQGVDALRMQRDGNLVLYKRGGKDAAWASDTNGNKKVRAVVEDSGDLVLYNSQGHIIWTNLRDLSKKWMKYLDDTLTLKQVCMPGSHDAGMYYTSQVWAPGLALTQDQNLHNQLKLGVRYFDLRPRNIDGALYIYHGDPNAKSIEIANGPKLEEVVGHIKTFMDEQSSETVILMFSQFREFNTEMDKAFIDMLEKYLSAYLLDTPSGNIENLPLSGLRGKIICIIDNGNLFRDAVVARGKKGYSKLNEKLKVFDKYSNKHEYQKMLDDQEVKFRDYNDDGLFLLNWTLTADPGKIAIATKTYLSVKHYADIINPKIMDEEPKQKLYQANKHGRIINIVNHDYVGAARAMEVCRWVMEH